MKLKKKIFFLATVNFAINAFMLNHLKELSKNFDVTVIVNTKDPNFLLNQGLNIKVIQLRFSRKIQILADLYCLIYLIFIFFKHKPNAVHSITPKAGFLAMFAAFITNVPLRIHTFTGQVWATKKGLKRFVLKFFDRLIVYFSTNNIIDSPSQQQFLVDEKVLTKNNSIAFGLGSVSGVNLKKFKPSKYIFNKIRQDLMLTKNAFVFTYLGRLTIDKGILDLALAFSKIRDKSAYLLIVGPDEGDLVERIKKINSHKLSQLRFIDYTESPENYLAATNVICLPSYREGFGSVIIEAAAMGVPAIASNIYGISDAVVNNKTGLLHTPADPVSILFCINAFLSDLNMVRKFGDAAKIRAIKSFDANLITAYWVNFYLKSLTRS